MGHFYNAQWIGFFDLVLANGILLFIIRSILVLFPSAPCFTSIIFNDDMDRRMARAGAPSAPATLSGRTNQLIGAGFHRRQVETLNEPDPRTEQDLMGFDRHRRYSHLQRGNRSRRCARVYRPELRRRGTDIDKILNKLVIFPAALGVLACETAHALPGLQVVRRELFGQNRLRDAGCGITTRQSDRGVDRHFIEPCPIRKEMPRCVHVRAGMGT